MFFGGVIGIAAVGIAVGKFWEISVNERQDLGIGVDDLTHRAESVAIVTDDLRQSIVVRFKTQHGFHLSLYLCSPWSLNNYEDRDASFIIKSNYANFGNKCFPQQKLFRLGCC
jgi:hypothetical protein